MSELTTLVPKYAEAKKLENDSKKTATKLGNDIKAEFANQNLDSFSAGGYTVTMSISTRDEMLEDKMIDFVKSTGIEGIVKTKEYIDTDELEKALYNEMFTEEQLLELSKCITKKEIKTLRVKKG
jgi:hypothetical protein|nr:MAG TPA: hypothetical protein [Caudoviricetes sp.]